MNFTTQQLKELYPAEIHFKSARTQGTIKNCPRWLTDKVADIFEAATKETVKRNWACSVCVFNFMDRVGKMYFTDLKELGKEAEKNTQVAVESELPSAEAPKKQKKSKKEKSSHK